MFFRKRTHVLLFISAILLFLFNYSLSAHIKAHENDSVFIKRYNKMLHYDSDAIFNNYAAHGYINSINDIYYYYYEILPALSNEKKNQEAEKIWAIAQKTNNEQLLHEAEYVKILVQANINSVDWESEERNLNFILDKAAQRKDTIMKLRIMESLFELYWTSAEYAKAFRQAYQLDKELQHVTQEYYPKKKFVYCNIGEAYFFFQDYEKAIPYLRKAIHPSKYYFDTSNLKARNTLGSYFIKTGNIDSAEYYFRTALYSNENVKDKIIYDALSLSNIGICFAQKEKYAKAISYFESSLSVALSTFDYKLASDVSFHLANCYLQTKNTKKAKQFIDSTQIYIRRSNNDDLYSSFYPLMCKYYSQKKIIQSAEAYFDSTLVANKEYEKKYSGLNILRAEQELHEMEKKAIDEIIKQNETYYKNKLLSSFVIIGIITTSLFFVLFLLHKNKKAYQVLILKNQEWAEVLPLSHNENESESEEKIEKKEEEEELHGPDEEDKILAQKAHDYLVNNKSFKNIDLTLDSLAKELNVNRNYLSKAINRTTGKNFNTYVNEYRVKEAIKIMSDKKMNLMSIDAIALEVGFGNRISFYQAFKKITGLSPSHFRDNKD